MFSILRAAKPTRMIASTAFAQRRAAGDMSRLTLIGRIVKDAEIRKTRTDKDYAVYTVAVTNPPLPVGEDGVRPPSTSTFHRIMSFRPSTYEYLSNLKKGCQVYVECGLEIREPDPEADPSTFQGQKQIFLKHQSIRVLQYSKAPGADSESETSPPEGYDHQSGF